MKEFWDERYSSDDYAYGVDANEFFKTELHELQPGTILLPAEGEGRNAVFAAKNGWRVEAFDISSEGKNKAMKLAQMNNVTIDYYLGELSQLSFNPESFDAIGLIFAHLPSSARRANHRALAKLLKKGGIIILEGFSKSHTDFQKQNPSVGGPSNPDALYTTQEIAEDFEGFEIINLEEKMIELSEGAYHVGTGSVVRFVGRKKLGRS